MESFGWPSWRGYVYSCSLYSMSFVKSFEEVDYECRLREAISRFAEKRSLPTDPPL